MVRNLFIRMLHAIKQVLSRLLGNSNTAIIEESSALKPPWFSQYEIGVMCFLAYGVLKYGGKTKLC